MDRAPPASNPAVSLVDGKCEFWLQVRDLLAFDEEIADMELQKTPTGFALPGLTKVPVTSAEQITDVMSRGYENRCTAAHDINAHSSRSHALLIVEVAATNLGSGIRTVGKLTLCDLAGRCARPTPLDYA